MTGDDNNKHLIYFLACSGWTCVSVFVELYFRETIFFCFGFFLFERLPDLAFGCVCLVVGVLCEIWVYFKLIISRRNFQNYQPVLVDSL